MVQQKLTEQERLDRDILYRTVSLKEHLGSGDVILTIKDDDTIERVGKLIRRALIHADGAIIKIREYRQQK